ncbi:MAG: glycosyltransferase family 4 protein [Methylacidiphilales bacterium]|nr:glycosyltransferase family 4 protein [Candidatus Methylacidiphilales bacterium]
MSSHRLHVLQIFNRYLQYGGEEGSVTRIGDALQAIHDVDYFIYSTSQLTAEAHMSKLLLPWKTYYNHDIASRLRRLKAGNPYDVWLIHNIFPAMSPIVYKLALEWKIPIIHYLHNYRFSCVNGFFLNHGKPCQRCLTGNFWPAFQTACWHESHLQSGWMGVITHHIRQLPLFEKVFRWIAISEAQKREHVRMGIPADKIKVVYHFLEAVAPPLPPSSSPTAIFVGRLSLEKGVDKLLEAWKLVGGGERKLVIVGDGPEKANLMQKAQGLKGVHFTGFVKGAEQKRYWQEALFSVVPSIWLEPFGMTVLESWSHGRPVVAHAIGALPELIHEGVNGSLADPENVEDLARRLDALLSNPRQAHSMGLAGRQHLEADFTQRRWLEEISTVFEGIRST